MCKEEKHGIMQPKWIRVQDALPTEDGEYYTIVELQHDSEGFKKGTIDIYRYNDWEDGEWRCEDYWWKVIYWAYPLTIELPAELADRPQWSYGDVSMRNEVVTDANGMPRTIGNLRKSFNGDIYVWLGNDEIGKRFLQDAEDSGLLIPASKTVPYPYAEVMALRYQSVGFVGANGMIRFQCGDTDDFRRIDYEKYVSGAEDYRYREDSAT